MISSTNIQGGLNTKLIGRSIHSFQIIGSTNTVARKLARSGAPEGTVVLAEHQTRGRGRFNRKWQGEPGKNILLSLILRPRDERIAPLLTYLTALCAADAVQGVTGKTVECKWPNDLLMNKRKFCGILLESSWKVGAHNRPRRRWIVNFVVIGLGMNVNQEKFPADLRQTATSLKIECGRELDRAPIIRNFLERLERGYLQSSKVGVNGMLTEWKAKCRTFGKEISVEQSGKILKGKAIDVDSDGALIIECRDRRTRVFAGDARVLN
jgi:BirA family biotin operon repressor/biotin-[acetyl-CoA-carboxylase] ligase